MRRSIAPAARSTERANHPSQPFRADHEDQPAAEHDEPIPSDEVTDDDSAVDRHGTVQPLGHQEQDPGNHQESEPAELIEDPVEQDAAGRRRVGRPQPRITTHRTAMFHGPSGMLAPIPVRIRYPSVPRMTPRPAMSAARSPRSGPRR